MESTAHTEVTEAEMVAGLGAYREAKAEKDKLARRAAQAKCKRLKRSALKENPKLQNAAKKADRRRKRTERAALEEIGLKETPKAERVSRKLQELGGRL